MLTVRKIIQNIEKGQSSIAVRYIFQSLNQLYEKNKDNIQIAFCSEKNNGLEIHLKIPSAERPGLYFDVVIWLNTNHRLQLDNMIKVYSNSPSFAYNFVYVFHKNNALLYPEKYPNIFLSTLPKVRNPLKTRGFDKHLYMGLKKITGLDLSKIALNFQGNAPAEIATFKEKNP